MIRLCITRCQNTEILPKFLTKSWVIRFLINIWSTFLVTMLFFKVLKKLFVKNYICQEKNQCRSTFFNRNNLKLQATNKTGESSTGVFLKILRNTCTTKWRLQINRWKIWLDIFTVNISYYYKRVLLIKIMKIL